MKPFIVFYATREGQTRRIAEHVAAHIRAGGRGAEAVDVRSRGEEPFDLERFAGITLAASVHKGKHEPEMVTFVKRHRDALERAHTAFLSVSMSEATVEDDDRPPELREKAEDDVSRMIAAFQDQTGWQPRRVKAVAGALLYTQYGFVIRFLMKQIARRAGGPTDTSRDYEYTDWNTLDRFVDAFVRDAHPEEDLAHAP